MKSISDALHCEIKMEVVFEFKQFNKKTYKRLKYDIGIYKCLERSG